MRDDRADKFGNDTTNVASTMALFTCYNSVGSFGEHEFKLQWLNATMLSHEIYILYIVRKKTVPQ
jgi:hypothetical protein